jgi:phospholipase/carboxylesterase
MTNKIEEKKEPHELSLLGFVHRFIPSKAIGKKNRSPRPTLLLLHGTGGDENDLIPLGRELAPDSALLSVRGKILEGGMPRFFRRFSEGVFDIPDLKLRTRELAEFVALASEDCRFDLNSVVAVGYSNGANIAASMFLLRPEVLLGATLFRAMVPFVPKKLPDLSGKSIFLSAGKFDPIVQSAQVEELKELLERSGALITMNWESADHSLTQAEIRKAKEFLQKSF